MRFGAPLLAAAAALLALGSATASAADPVPSLDLRGFQPPPDPAGFLYLEPAVTAASGNWAVGANASYALAPITLSNAGGEEVARVIEHQASLDYFVNMGLGKGFALALSLPTVVYQSGDDVRPANGAAAAVLPESAELPLTALGDVSLDAKKSLVVPADLGGLGVTLLGRATLPTGNRRSYVSDAGVRGELRILGELSLLALTVRATAGVRLRESEQVFLRDGTDTYRFGHAVPWGAGITVRPQALGLDREAHWRWTLETHGALSTTPTFAAGPQSPVALGLSARYTTGEVSALGGVELPLNDAVGNPLVRPVLGIAWAPRFEDADKDGIEDEVDECPELEEDRDGFQDADGCPDFDNDDDGVSDEDDKCPKGREDADEFQDEDGCDDPDNDGDGVLDANDACPNDRGSALGPKSGCPDPDPDHDGVPVEKDRCPGVQEDVDGFQDGDGCPDPDNDGDGVLDGVDSCPEEKGEPNAAVELAGCVNPDHDGDTFDDAIDKCPGEPEDFDGVEDDDGCLDAKNGAPLVVIADSAAGKVVTWKAPRFANDDIDPKSLPTLRALAQQLNAHPTWIVAVGARATGPAAAAEQVALNHAFAVALNLRWLTHRDAAAETVGWGAVRDLSGAAASGIGILVLAPRD